MRKSEKKMKNEHLTILEFSWELENVMVQICNHTWWEKY